jgi:hypothetical protein
MRAGMSNANPLSPDRRQEYFLIEGVLVVVSESPTEGKLALAYTSDGACAYNLSARFCNAKRISEEEFLVRLTHIQSTGSCSDGQRQKLPPDVSPKTVT